MMANNTYLFTLASTPYRPKSLWAICNLGKRAFWLNELLDRKRNFDLFVFGFLSL